MTQIIGRHAPLPVATDDVKQAASLVADAYRIGGAASLPVPPGVADLVDAAASWEALPAIRDVRELVSGHTTEECANADT